MPLNQTLGTVAALVAGAAAMYFFDPQSGRRRRAMVRDRAVAAGHDVGGFASAKSKRAADRARGIVAQARSRWTAHAEEVSDAQLNERVRAKLGRVVSHPKAIHTDVAHGRVGLSGEILAAELTPLLAALWATPGVKGIDNRLSVHVQAGREPSLQGDVAEAQERRNGSRLRPLLPWLAIGAPLAIAIGAAQRGGTRALRRWLH